ncbi:DUF2207 family protein [Pseudothermotoga sp. U03pept]|uniref:DUF2207 family protein n=1 Tax=Pseudothermotoga sp. U03pept TaxID=3447012 RepID=UPI003F0FF68B
MKVFRIVLVVTFLSFVAFGIIVGLVYGSFGLLELPHRSYSLMLNEDGTANVVETITYKLNKPFRLVSWAIDFDYPTTIEDFEIEILEGPPLQGGIYYNQKTERKIDVEIRFSQSMDVYVPVPKGGQIVKVAFKYKLTDVLEEGADFTQLFIKYIGENNDVGTKHLDVHVVFPESFPKPLVYHHPWGIQTKDKNILGRTYEFSFARIPASSFIEGRFVFPGLTGTGTRFLNKDLKLSEIEKAERGYLIRTTLIVLGVIAYTLFVLVVPIQIYRKYGREMSIEYNAEYERELPYKDLPEFVNSVVKKSCSRPDDDAIAAAVLDGVRKGECQFVENEKGEIVGLKILNVSEERRELFSAFADFATNGVVDFKTMKKELKKTNKAQEFLEKVSNWRRSVLNNVKKRNYLDETGDTAAKVFAAVFGLFVPLLIMILLNNMGPTYSILARYGTMLMAACAGVGVVVLLMKKSVFSRWNRDGLLYYLKWKNFEKFIQDFSALSTYPPQSVAIWDEYIVYATALGVAKRVIENLQKLYPEPPSSPVTGTVYRYPVVIGEISSLRSVAASTVSSSSSGSGGSRIGGGGGGSRVGAR